MFCFEKALQSQFNEEPCCDKAERRPDATHASNLRDRRANSLVSCVFVGPVD